MKNMKTAHRAAARQDTRKEPAHTKPSPKPPVGLPSPKATTYTLVTEPDQGLTAIYNLISSAKKSIDMTMYELTDITVTSSLAKAAVCRRPGTRHPRPERREDEQHPRLQSSRGE